MQKEESDLAVRTKNFALQILAGKSADAAFHENKSLIILSLDAKAFEQANP
jgi:hypothetical protein